MTPFVPFQRETCRFSLLQKIWPLKSECARNSFVESLGISYQINTGKCNIFPLQLKLELDLIPAKSHIWMVRVSICKSLK